MKPIALRPFRRRATDPDGPQPAKQGANIGQVGGNRDERVRQLWDGPSDQVDSTIFELLTAAGCVQKGRAVDFLPTTQEKSPDLRCHDPFPIVIECKRQASISEYEVAEEAIMRSLFLKLREAARRKGLNGTFRLTLSVEASQVDLNEVVDRLVSQRLAPRPERELSYRWGSTSFTHLPSSMELPDWTRIYSPNMLEYLFDWTSDLPDWDGICCSVSTAGEPIVGKIRQPVALVWKNVSPKAFSKRTWAPTNLFGQASLQVPAGRSELFMSATRKAAGPRSPTCE